jgi:hypothetical protein
MRKKIVSMALALVILFVLLILLDPGFREKVKVIVAQVNGWLGIDWGSIEKWRSAEWTSRMIVSLIAY